MGSFSKKWALADATDLAEDPLVRGKRPNSSEWSEEWWVSLYWLKVLVGMRLMGTDGSWGFSGLALAEFSRLRGPSGWLGPASPRLLVAISSEIGNLICEPDILSG